MIMKKGGHHSMLKKFDAHSLLKKFSHLHTIMLLLLLMVHTIHIKLISFMKGECSLSYMFVYCNLCADFIYYNIKIFLN